MKSLRFVIPFLLLSASAFAADIVDTAASNPRFSTLVSLVQRAGLVETLKRAAPLTVFAPTNEAFARLPKSVVGRLMANPELLRRVLTFHVVGARVDSAAAIEVATKRPSQTVTTLEGSPLRLSFDNPERALFIDQSKVIAVDVKADNGLIHVIDRVLIPGN